MAAGHLKVNQAWIVAAVLGAIALTSAFFLDLSFFGLLTIYVVTNIVYTIKLKHVVIIDVMCIAFGFVLRVLAGTALAGVRASDWLIVCTITLSLFLGFSKRRHELALIDLESSNHRKVLADYGLTFLDQMIAVATACTVMSYALYTIADETIARFGTRNLVFTIPFVIYGVYRYLYLIHQKNVAGNPTIAVMTDLPLLLNGILWLAAVVFIVY